MSIVSESPRRKLTCPRAAWVRSILPTMRQALATKSTSLIPADLLQMKEVDDVAGHHAVALLLGHAGKVALQDRVGLRPVGFLVREVRGPDELVHAHAMAQRHARRIELEAPVAVLDDVLAGIARQPLPAERLLHPAAVPLVAGVAHLEEQRDPADLVLGEEDPQVREALEHAVERELHGVDAATAGVLGALRRKVAPGRDARIRPVWIRNQRA